MHVGHVQLAHAAQQALGLDALLCIPAGAPPHRPAPIASATDRLAMARLAFDQGSGCHVDDAEVLQNGPSWTIRTLERLRQAAPDQSLVLIVGADALLGLPTWLRWHELLDFAHIAVANRPGSELNSATLPDALAKVWHNAFTTDLTRLHQQSAGCLVSFNIAPCPVSATQVRQACKQGTSLQGLVPAAVENYIRDHHLYPQATH